VIVKPGGEVGDAVDDVIGASTQESVVGAAAGTHANREANAGGAARLHVVGVIAYHGRSIHGASKRSQGAVDVVGIGFGAGDIISCEEHVVGGEPSQHYLARGAAVPGDEGDTDSRLTQARKGLLSAGQKAGLARGANLQGDHRGLGLGAKRRTIISQARGDRVDLLDHPRNVKRRCLYSALDGDASDSSSHGVEVIGASCHSAIHIQDDGFYRHGLGRSRVAPGDRAINQGL